MFSGAASFNQDVSKWDVSKIQVAPELLFGTVVHLALKKYCGRDSFFDADCVGLTRKDRQEFFSAAFPWSHSYYF